VDSKKLRTTEEPSKEDSAEQLVGLCARREHVGRAAEALEEAGFARDEISVVLAADGKLPDDGVDTRADASKYAALGGAIGTIGGAGLAGLTAVTGISLAGVGVFATGPLGLALAVLGSGGVAGGLIGALIGVGLPEDASRTYVDQLEKGAGLVAVSLRSEASDSSDPGSRRRRAERAFAAAGLSEMNITTRRLASPSRTLERVPSESTDPDASKEESVTEESAVDESGSRPDA